MDAEESQVVAVKLGWSNYTTWAYSMKRFLISKEAWKYVDGTLETPVEGTENYAELLSEWDTVNAKILTWINDSVEPSIGKHLQKFSLAKEVWDRLAREFTKVNIGRKYKLEKCLRGLVQGNRSVQEFYSLMTSIWDELAMMEPPELTSLDYYVKFREEQRLVQFLVALRPEFEPLTKRILLRSPLPSVADTVNELIAEEPRLPVGTRVKPCLIPNQFLPDEMIREILTWLPTKSLMRCKCVSRRWRSIIRDPSFAREHRGGFRGLLISEPIYWTKDSRRAFYYLSLFDGPVKYLSHHLTLNLGVQRMGCTNTVNGLLCFYYSNYSCLYNIATRECRGLPLSRHEASSCSYHLGFDPTSKLYKLLKICPVYKDYDDNIPYPEDSSEFVHNLDSEILTLGNDSSWRNIKPAPGEIRSRSICLNGLLYWMDPDSWDSGYPDNHVIAFQLGHEEFQIIPVPNPGSWYLLQFGPGLALARLESHYESMVFTAVISHYGNGQESGVWTEHKFDFPTSSKYHFMPVGILPDGKVVLFDENMDIHCPSKFYIYDPTKMSAEKTIICKSPSSSELKEEGICGYKSYYEENIIPLSCLIARP